MVGTSALVDELSERTLGFDGDVCLSTCNYNVKDRQREWNVRWRGRAREPLCRRHFQSNAYKGLKVEICAINTHRLLYPQYSLV